MNESDFINKIEKLLATKVGSITGLTIAAIVADAEEYPASAEVQLRVAELLMKCRADGLAGVVSPVEYYQRAISLSPWDHEAWEGLGFALDVLRDDSFGAEDALRKAIDMGAGPTAYAGLARLLSERGDRDSALAVLSEPYCKYCHENEIAIRRQEILRGDWDPI